MEEFKIRSCAMVIRLLDSRLKGSDRHACVGHLEECSNHGAEHSQQQASRTGSDQGETCSSPSGEHKGACSAPSENR